MSKPKILIVDDEAAVADLIEAVEGNKEGFHVFVDSRGREIVLDSKKAAERGPLILERYKIDTDRRLVEALVERDTDAARAGAVVQGRLIATIIPRNIRIAEAPGFGQSICSSRAQTRARAAEGFSTSSQSWSCAGAPS